MTHADDFRDEIEARFRRGIESGAACVEINSDDVHRAVGGYPGPDRCDAMYDEMTARDELLSAPPKGKGATVTIRYQLPR